MKKNKHTAIKSLQKLEQIEFDLMQGATCFSITRLVVLKKLCKDRIARHCFAKYLCNKAFHAYKRNKNSGETINTAIVESLHLMDLIIENEKSGNLNYPAPLRAKLKAHYYKLITYQNQTRRGHFGTQIRTITNMNLFRIELCIKSFLFDDEKIGYEMGRHYSEKYQPAYGTGLIPDSLPYIQDIVRFWKEYLNG